jgi:hypothetical protein
MVAKKKHTETFGERHGPHKKMQNFVGTCNGARGRFVMLEKTGCRLKSLNQKLKILQFF